ncbi:unnamed protein product [Fusarium equiseti]|uniref:Uncharacterized protein n=1 Tax=Fusarium equiseti TaxID=61235 RepID=A0A8J2NET9_FUSEQ|nr:unnamed protein product [Fusarium equiseti]
MMLWTGQSDHYDLVSSHMIGKVSDIRGLIHLTLLQSFPPPTSRKVAESLRDKEAVLPADVKSKGDAIWISSDDDFDTEDEGDAEGHALDDLRSCTTSTTSIADHFDSRSTKHSPIELEAATGVDTTPAVSLSLGENDPDLDTKLTYGCP